MKSMQLRRRLWASTPNPLSNGGKGSNKRPQSGSLNSIGTESASKTLPLPWRESSGQSSCVSTLANQPSFQRLTEMKPRGAIRSKPRRFAARLCFLLLEHSAECRVANGRLVKPHPTVCDHCTVRPDPLGRKDTRALLQASGEKFSACALSVCKTTIAHAVGFLLPPNWSSNGRESGRFRILRTPSQDFPLKKCLGFGASSWSLVCGSCGDGTERSVRNIQSASSSPTMSLCQGYGLVCKAAMEGGGLTCDL
jgi:hypothetical protein